MNQIDKTHDSMVNEVNRLTSRLALGKTLLRKASVVIKAHINHQPSEVAKDVYSQIQEYFEGGDDG